MTHKFLGLIAAVMLIGCAFKRTPLRITVEAPAEFSGRIRLTPCAAGPAETKIATNGEGRTSACPASDEEVELLVFKNGRQIYIPPKDIQIGRTGDGFATIIETQIK